MNYLTAILAFPLFNILVLFELYIYWKAPEINNPLNLRLARSYLVVSVLQTISVWFWFFGFVFSKVNSVFGEGYAPGEECNCFGLVGAEVVLSIFQWIMTCATAYQAMFILRVSTSKETQKRSGRGCGDVFFYVFCGLLAIYTGFCWITAHNRRCPQGIKYLIELQHFFYPVWLVIDMLLYGMTAGKLMKLRQKLEESVTNRIMSKTQGGSSAHNGSKTAGGSDNGASKPSAIMATANDTGSSNGTTAAATTTGNALVGGSSAAANDARNNKSLRSMRETVRTYTLALIVTGVTGVIGVIVFFLQFVANIPGFSLIACLYCLMMYIGYVARRTPFLIMWCKWEPPAWLANCLGRRADGPLLPVASASATASMTSSPSSAFGAGRTAR